MVSVSINDSTIFGGYTAERNISVFCDYNDDPNGTMTTDMYPGDSNSATRGGPYCDQTKFSIPFRQEFKISGTYPLPFGIDFGAVLQAYPGNVRVIMYTPAASLFPGGRTNSETIEVSPPGSLYYPRYSQVDINFKKNFRSGQKRFSLQLDFFNALNANAIWGANNNIGSSLGQVTSILPGRLPRIAFQMQW